MKQPQSPAEKAVATADRVIELIERYGEDLDKKLKGHVPGYVDLQGRDFVRWFNWMAMQNPNWVQALKHFPSGQKLLDQYARISQQAADEGNNAIMG